MSELIEYNLREMVLRLAHQIRNPLATIKSGIQLVQHLLPSNGEVEEYLDAALVEVERINHTVADMQRVIRLDSATARANPVEEIVVEAVSRCAAKAESAGVFVASSGGPRCHVLADPVQMVEAICELLSNAIQFSPLGARIAVAWAVDADRMVRIDIVDACGGIPEATADRILHPFFSTSTTGTGLGVNIVQRICELGGGRLEWANTADGAGCRFSILMPEV